MRADSIARCFVDSSRLGRVDSSPVNLNSGYFGLLIPEPGYTPEKVPNYSESTMGLGLGSRMSCESPCGKKFSSLSGLHSFPSDSSSGAAPPRCSFRRESGGSSGPTTQAARPRRQLQTYDSTRHKGSGIRGEIYCTTCCVQPLSAATYLTVGHGDRARSIEVSVYSLYSEGTFSPSRLEFPGL